MNKKGEGMITGIIMAVIAILLISALLIPLVKQSTDNQPYNENLVRDAAPTSEAVSMTSSDTLVDSSLVIPGLTLAHNYTVDYTTGVVTFNSNTSNGTYEAAYEVQYPGYLTSSGDRTLMGIIVLASIIAILLATFAMFGMRT